MLKTILEHVQFALDTKTQPNFTVITNTNIQESLNEIFLLLGLPEIAKELANQITVCIISLLQSVKVGIKRQSNTMVLELPIGICKQYIYLYGKGRLPAGHIIMFPLIVANNDNYIPSIHEDLPLILNNLIEIKFVNNDCIYDFPD